MESLIKNGKELISVFEKLGWQVGKDEAGDRFCCISMETWDLSVIPILKKRKVGYELSFMPSVGLKIFSDAASYIFNKEKDYQPIIVGYEWWRKVWKKDFFSAMDIEELSVELTSWAKAQDVNKGLEAYRNLPTDAKGSMPLCHLAALAIAGDVARLTSYQESFKHGDRLDFVPYITTEMIDRAVLIAKKHSG